MNHNEHAAPRVVAVLLADGWHKIIPSSFSVGPMGFGATTDLGVPGFRFEEADAGSPHQPTMLAGPLDSIIAIRQVTAALRGHGEPDRPTAALNGRLAAQEARLRVHTDRAAARG